MYDSWKKPFSLLNDLTLSQENWFPFSCKYSIGFPAHFRHLCNQFHQFSIQFRPETLTAFKPKVHFCQIVIHIPACFVNQMLKF